MYPACIATVALMVAGGTSTGGLTAVVVKKLRAKTNVKNIDPKTQTKGETDGPPKNRVSG
jgi:hypothetical protein